MQGMVPLAVTILKITRPLEPRFSSQPARCSHRQLSAVHAMARHHLDLLLALLYGCAFAGALFDATSLVLLAFLAGALLVTFALAMSDALRLAGPAARVAHEAAANLRLARSLAVYTVLKATLVVALVVRAKIGALASRVRMRGGLRAVLHRCFGFVV